jgi:hypothetical protein
MYFQPKASLRMRSLISRGRCKSELWLCADVDKSTGCVSDASLRARLHGAGDAGASSSGRGRLRSSAVEGDNSDATPRTYREPLLRIACVSFVECGGRNSRVGECERKR